MAVEGREKADYSGMVERAVEGGSEEAARGTPRASTVLAEAAAGKAVGAMQETEEAGLDAEGLDWEGATAEKLEAVTAVGCVVAGPVEALETEAA